MYYTHKYDLEQCNGKASECVYCLVGNSDDTTVSGGQVGATLLAASHCGAIWLLRPNTINTPTITHHQQITHHSCII